MLAFERVRSRHICPLYCSTDILCLHFPLRRGRIQALSALWTQRVKVVFLVFVSGPGRRLHWQRILVRVFDSLGRLWDACFALAGFDGGRLCHFRLLMVFRLRCGWCRRVERADVQHYLAVLRVEARVCHDVVGAYCSRCQKAGEKKSGREALWLGRQSEEGATRSRHARLLAGSNLQRKSMFIACLFLLH